MCRSKHLQFFEGYCESKRNEATKLQYKDFARGYPCPKAGQFLVDTVRSTTCQQILPLANSEWEAKRVRIRSSMKEQRKEGRMEPRQMLDPFVSASPHPTPVSEPHLLPIAKKWSGKRRIISESQFCFIKKRYPACPKHKRFQKICWLRSAQPSSLSKHEIR